MTDIVERLRACQGVLTHDPECNCVEAADEIERLTAERDDARAAQLVAEKTNAPRLVARADNERLRTALQKLDWKSIDKDNMEFSCRIPYNVMDEIRRALEPKP